MRLKGRQSLAYGSEVRFCTGQLFLCVSPSPRLLMFDPTDINPVALFFHMKIINE